MQNTKNKVEVIEEVQHSVDLAVNILNDLLAYEKLEGNIMQTQTKRLKVWRFIQDSIRPFMLQVSMTNQVTKPITTVYFMIGQTSASKFKTVCERRSK